MNDHIQPWVFHCEVMKKGLDVTERYQVKVIVLLDDHHQLDSKINDVLKKAGLLFLYSGEGKPIIEYLQQADFYDQLAIELSQEACKEKPIVFQITKLLSSDKTENQPKEYVTITKHSIAALPNQDHLKSWEKQWISETLKALLFQHAATPMPTENDTQKLRTYLILDAHIYTSIKGMFDLDMMDETQIQSLYKGRTAQELKYVAPYLIDMTLEEFDYEGKEVASRFHRDYFSQQWGKDTAIFIRTAASIDTLVSHFRKFTRISNVHDKNLFFRFYDPNILNPYLHEIQDWPQRLAHLFAVQSSFQIESIICHNSEDSALCYTPTAELLQQHNEHQNAPPLGQRDYDICIQIGLTNQAKKLLNNLYSSLAQSHDLVAHPDHLPIAISTLTRMRGFGLKTPLFVEILIAWSLLISPLFEQPENDDSLLEILNSELAQHDKFMQLSARMKIIYGQRV